MPIRMSVSVPNQPVNSSNNCLYRCSTTYYNPVSCKWQKGTFLLYRNYLEFTSDETTYLPFHLTLPLSTISSLRKCNASLFFPSLVLQVGSENHWFSSFSSRDSVYNLIELFQKKNLLDKARDCGVKNATDSKTVTPLGKKLLRILHESEDTLVETATMLDEQSQQLEDIQENVEDMNSDLSFAEKVMKALPFFPHGTQQQVATNNKTDTTELVVIKRRKYKVNFTNAKEDNVDKDEWTKGFLVLGSHIDLLDEEENIKFKIQISELLSIVIVSPWELCINQDCYGKTNCYKIMCPSLSHLHKVLMSNPVFESKMTYKDDCEDAFFTCSSRSSLSTASDAGSVASPVSGNPEVNHLVAQVEEAKDTLTTEELCQISAGLRNLQMLATEVIKEQECQMEKIGHLITDADKSDIQIRKDNQNMKKMV